MGCFLVDLSGGLPPESVVVVAVTGLLLALALAGRRTSDAGRVELLSRGVPTVRTEALVVVLTLAVGTVVGFVGNTAFATRYTMVVVPVAVVIVAVGVAVIDHRLIRLVLFLVLVAGGAVGVGQELGGSRSQMQEVAVAVAAEAEPGDVVVYCPDQLGPSGDRALRAELGDDVGGLTQVRCAIAGRAATGRLGGLRRAQCRHRAHRRGGRRAGVGQCRYRRVRGVERGLPHL